MLGSLNDSHQIIDEHPNWFATKNNVINKQKSIRAAEINSVKAMNLNQKPKGVNSIMYIKRKEEQEKYKKNGRNKTQNRIK